MNITLSKASKRLSIPLTSMYKVNKLKEYIIYSNGVKMFKINEYIKDNEKDVIFSLRVSILVEYLKHIKGVYYEDILRGSNISPKTMRRTTLTLNTSIKIFKFIVKEYKLYIDDFNIYNGYSGDWYADRH